jgi:hypothetical protein
MLLQKIIGKKKLMTNFHYSKLADQGYIKASKFLYICA